MSEPERVKWTDPRLDDRFDAIAKEIDERFDAIAKEVKGLRELERNVVVFGEELRNLRRDVDGAASSIREHRDEFTAFVAAGERAKEANRDERKVLAERHRLERKSDRRWMIGTVLTSAALIIAAVGLLLGHIG